MKKIIKLLFMLVSIMVLGFATFNVVDNKKEFKRDTITYQYLMDIDVVNTQQSNALSLIKYNLYTLYLAEYYDNDNKKYEYYYVFE